MSHFAQIDENNNVIQVLVIEQDVVDSGLFGDPQFWIQTSYNTHGGVHINGGTPLRKNYAGIGYIYDTVRDAFYEPKPFNSWTLNEETCIWMPPASYPSDGNIYSWDEDSLSWIILEEL
jgi:hypothetical protein